MTHYSHGSRRQPTSLDDLRSAVSGDVIDAAKAASEELRKKGVRHALVGGLAVGMNGYPRATSDVDFIVGDEAFDFHGPIVSPKQGIPMKWKGVTIDWVSEDRPGALEPYKILPEPDEVPVVPAEVVVYMKLIAGRQKDKADVVELVKAGIDLDDARGFVREHRPDLLTKFEKLVKAAKEEET